MDKFWEMFPTLNKKIHEFREKLHQKQELKEKKKEKKHEEKEEKAIKEAERQVIIKLTSFFRKNKKKRK